MQLRRSDIGAALLAGFAIGVVLIALWMTVGGGETAVGLRTSPDSVIAEEAAASQEVEVARDGMIFNAEARVRQRLAADEVRTQPLSGTLRIRARDVRWLDASGGAWARAPAISASLDADAIRGGNVLLRDVVLENADLRLVQTREGAPWNYERALAPLMEGGNDGSGARRFAIAGMRVRDSRIDVRLPNDHLTFESLDADASSVVLAGPNVSDPRLTFTRLNSTLVLHERDRRIAVAATSADLRVLDDGVAFDVASLRIDESQIADLDGVWSRELPGWGFRMTGRAIGVQLADVQFLAPERIPDEGTATFRFAIDPESAARTRVALTDIDARSGESRVLGAVTAFVLTEGFSIANADLRVDPLQLALVEQMLGRELPYGGTLRGTLRGDAADLRFDVDALLTSASSEIPLETALEGTIAFNDAGEFELRRVLATLEDAPLASLRAVVPGIPFGGTISGTIALEGSPDRAPLDVDVRLRLANGVFAVAGVLDLTGPVPSYDLEGNIIGLNLAQMFTAFAPPAELTGHFTLAGSGADPETMDARITLGGRFTGWETSPNDVIRARALVRGGAVQVDTLSMRLATLSLESAGRWQFVAPQAGAIEYALDISSLAPWGPYLPVVGDSTMRGAVAARGTVNGPLDAIRVAGAVQGVRVRAANGWRAEQLDATYDIAFGAAVPTVTLEAQAQTVTTPTAGSFDVLTADLALTPPQFALTLTGDRAGADTPVVELVADGRVPYEGLREIVVQRAHLDIEDGVWRLTQPATFSWGGESAGLVVRDLEFRNDANEGRVAIDGTVFPVRRADVQIDVARVPIGDVQRLIGQEPVVTGDLWADGVFRTIAETTADVDMTFRLDSGAVLGVDLTRLEGTVAYRDGRLVTNAVAAFDTAGTLDIEIATPFRVALADSVDLGLGETGSISGRIIADSLSLAPFDALLTDVRDMEGRVSGTLAIGGTIEEPNLDGTLRLVNGAVTMVALDQRYEQITGTATLAGRVVTITSLTAHAGGTATLTGTIELTELTEPVFDVAATMDAFHVMGVDDEAPAEVSGTVNLDGPLTGLVMTGGVSVTDGAVVIPDFRGSTLDEAIFLEPGEMQLDDPLATGNPVLDNLRIRNLDVDIEGDVWFIVENQVRAQLAGELIVNKTGEEYRVIGELEGERGTYTLAAGPIVRRFDINYARLTFQDETELNPTLEVLASRTIIDQTGRPVDIDVNIGGTMRAPTLALGSGDATGIPQSELLSFLFFGQPSFALGGGALPGAAVLEQTLVGGIAELASIELQNELGDAGLPLDVFQIRLGGFGALEGAPMLVLGREIADDVFLTVESYLSGLFGSSQTGLDLWAIRLEWAFDPRSSLRAGLEPVSSALRLRGIGLDRPTAPGQQFSVELRRRWTY